MNSKDDRNDNVIFYLDHIPELGVSLEEVLEVLGLEVGVLHGHQRVQHLQEGLNRISKRYDKCPRIRKREKLSM